MRRGKLRNVQLLHGPLMLKWDISGLSHQIRDLQSINWASPYSDPWSGVTDQRYLRVGWVPWYGQNFPMKFEQLRGFNTKASVLPELDSTCPLVLWQSLNMQSLKRYLSAVFKNWEAVSRSCKKICTSSLWGYVHLLDQVSWCWIVLAH